MKHWLVLENKKQYEAALKRVDELMAADPNQRYRVPSEILFYGQLPQRQEVQPVGEWNEQSGQPGNRESSDYRVRRLVHEYPQGPGHR